MEDKTMSLVELAIEIQSNATEKTTFIDLYKKVCEIKEFTDEEKNEHIAQFYTDITACGDFVYCGEDLWDLKKNQKLEALDSEFYSEHTGFDDDEDEEPKKKTKTKKSKKHQESALDLEEKENKEEIDTEDESYENIQNDYEPLDDDDDDDYSSYEKDLDSELDDDDDDDKDSYEDDDEDKYNSIMDEYENLYDD